MQQERALERRGRALVGLAEDAQQDRPGPELLEPHIAHPLGSGDRVVLEATLREARSRGDVVVGTERDDEDVRVVRACVGRHVASRRIDRGYALLAELDARLRESAVGDPHLRGISATEEDVELREPEGEGVVLVDQRDAKLVAERSREPARELQPAESGPKDDDVLHPGNPTLRIRKPSRDTPAPRARAGGSPSDGGRSQLLEDRRDVLLDRADGEDERARRSRAFERPSAISASTSFSRGVSSRASRSCLRPTKCATTSGSSAVPPSADAADGLDEGVDVHHTVLEQVADAAAAVGEQLARVRLLDVLREDEDRRLGHALAHASARPAAPRRETSAASGCRRSRCRDARGARRARERRRPRPLRRLRSRCRAGGGSGRRAAARDPPRSRRARQHRFDHRRPALGAGDSQRAVERLDALPQPVEAAAGLGHSAASVVEHAHDERVVPLVHVDVDP